MNVSSIAALDPLPGSGRYAAAKAAVTGLSEALAAELAPFGIGVTVVEPGAFRTDFLSGYSARHTGRTIDSSADAGTHVTGRAGRQPGDPDRAAQVIIEAVESDRPPLHLVLGADALLRTRRRLTALLSDGDGWADASTSTAYA